jgi:hypothetical protein
MAALLLMGILGAAMGDGSVSPGMGISEDEARARNLQNRALQNDAAERARLMSEGARQHETCFGGCAW